METPEMTRVTCPAIGWIVVVSVLMATILHDGVSRAEAGALYFRSGVSSEPAQDAIFMDVDCKSSSPAALYGCGKDRTGAPRQSLGQFRGMETVELGVGYETRSAARFELLLAYRPSFRFEGRSNFLAPGRMETVSAEMSSFSGLLAAFVDLREPSSPSTGKVIPFVGFGVGTARTEIGQTTLTFPATKTIVPGASTSNSTVMLTAGFGVELNEFTTLDVAWRYSDLGEIRTGAGAGSVVWHDGRREPLPLDLAPTRSSLASHGIHISLRRKF